MSHTSSSHSSALQREGNYCLMETSWKYRICGLEDGAASKHANYVRLKTCVQCLEPYDARSVVAHGCNPRVPTESVRNMQAQQPSGRNQTDTASKTNRWMERTNSQESCPLPSMYVPCTRVSTHTYVQMIKSFKNRDLNMFQHL